MDQFDLNLPNANSLCKLYASSREGVETLENNKLTIDKELKKTQQAGGYCRNQKVRKILGVDCDVFEIEPLWGRGMGLIYEGKNVIILIGDDGGLTLAADYLVRDLGVEGHTFVADSSNS